MTTIFDGYDEEYRALTSDISKKISEVASYEDQRGILVLSPLSGALGAHMLLMTRIRGQEGQHLAHWRSADAGRPTGTLSLELMRVPTERGV